MLPKGIVTNTGTIYTEVAAYPTVPADKVWQYWHVYTTTNKKLKDPTACRLENFWWHVWGSDRRFLSGRALARLYENISLGPTIAPLQGPPNRWEGPNVPVLTRQLIVAHLSKIQPASHHGDPKPILPAKLACPAPHSTPLIVVDKAKGPSSSAMKPTVRFATPPESPNEHDKESDSNSSDSTAAPGLEMPVKVPTKKRAPPLPPKKFVAPSAAARRRPVLPRRSSPQSPASTASASRHDDLSELRSEVLPRAVSPIPETTPNHHVAAARKAPGATNVKLVHPPSVKVLGKRPAMSRRSVSEKHDVSTGHSAPLSSSRGQESPRRSKAPPLPRAHSLVHAWTHSHTASSIPGATTLPAPHPPAHHGASTTPPMMRSQSHGAYSPGPTNHRHDRSPSQGLFTTATASMSNIAARGTIIDQSGSLPASTALEPLPGEPWLQSKPLASPLLDARLTPTQPSPAASVPMGRTRSQLTLLLEREKARIGDKARSKS
ncbi:hypothetical protein CDD82_7874 [Ophiocordyceps australis]|uniref:Nitrogen regulatory protein areA GATA-like domain-containing protein n=1 Tax=Ophiocordyceps australis TaxID=1399860 RepID=A0A2C5YP15_9HYPO|nr:hypothetical protein CDD82_7874 [Ophiocordyceps australis]